VELAYDLRGLLGVMTARSGVTGVLHLLERILEGWPRWEMVVDGTMRGAGNVRRLINASGDGNVHYRG
jgi:hypothetical protein